MEDTLINFETAKLAKEKGFDIFTEKMYRQDGILGNSDFSRESTFRAPTQSLLQKWLREVHNCFIDILPHRDGDSKNKQWKNKEDVFWTVEVDYYGKNFEIELTDYSDFIQHFNKTYEKALEKGLQEALKLIK